MKLLTVVLLLVVAIAAKPAKEHGKGAKEHKEHAGKGHHGHHGKGKDSDSSSSEEDRPARHHGHGKHPSPVGQVKLHFHCACEHAEGENPVEKPIETPTPGKTGVSGMPAKKSDANPHEDCGEEHSKEDNIEEALEKHGLKCECKTIEVDGHITLPLFPPKHHGKGDCDKNPCEDTGNDTGKDVGPGEPAPGVPAPGARAPFSKNKH